MKGDMVNQLIQWIHGMVPDVNVRPPLKVKYDDGAFAVLFMKNRSRKLRLTFTGSTCEIVQLSVIDNFILQSDGGWMNYIKNINFNEQSSIETLWDVIKPLYITPIHPLLGE